MPTILELFQNNQVLSNQVKPDKRTLVDVETSGIRVDTKVDVIILQFMDLIVLELLEELPICWIL